jgi:hypothetical protein
MPIKIEIVSDDPIIVAYLESFPAPKINQGAIEAMRVGILAIHAAGPSLDASVVDRAFRDAESRIRTLVEGAEKDLKNLLESNLRSAFGDRGQVQGLLDRYFSESGTVRTLVGKLVGPGSDFFKSIDPANREGVLARIEEALKSHLGDAITVVLKQFSLDESGSALARLKKTLDDQMSAVRDSMTALIGQVQRVTGHEEGKAEEAERGAGKGMSFEDSLYAAVAKMAKGLDDASESTQGTVGTIPRSKVGDAIITLGETAGAPGARIVMEFKMDRGYKVKTAQDEMATARRNREAQFGIMVFAKGYEPVELGDFRRIGMDIFCTADLAELEAGRLPPTVSAAYAVARALVIAASKVEKGGPNVAAIQQNADALAALAERLSEITTKAQTVINAGTAIDEVVRRLQAEIRQRVAEILKETKSLVADAA